MTQSKNVSVLKSVVTYLKLPAKSLSEGIKLEDEGLLICNILTLMKKEKIYFSSFDYKEQIVIQQFLEYAITHLKGLSNYSTGDVSQILKDVNELMSDRVYLIGNKQNVVDLVFYEMLYSTMVKLTFSDRERYLHLSRWFTQVQEDDLIRQNRPRLLFSRTLLYT